MTISVLAAVPTKHSVLPQASPFRKAFLIPLLLALLVAATFQIARTQNSGWGTVRAGSTLNLRSAFEGDVPFPAQEGEGKFLLTTVAVTPLSTFDHWVNKFVTKDPVLHLTKEEELAANAEEIEQDELRVTDIEASKSAAAFLATRFVGHSPYVFFSGVGTEIIEVVADPALSSGLKPGDTIVAIDGNDVENFQDLKEGIENRASTLIVTVKRGLSLEHIDVPFSVWHTKLGVTATTMWQPGGTASMDSAAISGASGGLMMTLAHLDALTQGDLTGGRNIAGTGAVDANGNVLPVLGVQQKIEGAFRDGATLFFLPEEFRTTPLDVPASMSVVFISHWEEALGFLCANGSTDSACQ